MAYLLAATSKKTSKTQKIPLKTSSFSLIKASFTPIRCQEKWYPLSRALVRCKRFQPPVSYLATRPIAQQKTSSPIIENNP